MTEWIVDHIDWVLIFLGLVAAALAVAWWNTRRRPYLIGAAAMVGLMLVCYVASLFIVTDAMQLSRNVDGIRDAINAGKPEEAMQFFENKVIVKTASGPQEYSKDSLVKLARLNMQHYAVKKVFTRRVQVEELHRPKATVRFAVSNEEGDKTGWCVMKFHHADGKWRVEEFTVESFVGGQTAPVLFPFGGQ